MFKKVHSQVWAFDLEWAPDPQAGRILYRLPAEVSDADVLGEMWKRGGATADDPQPFLKTALCRVLSIAAVQRVVRGGKTELKLIWLPRDAADAAQCDERAMLEKFLHAVGKFQPQLVGFNSTASDLKILAQRGVIRGLHAPEFCRRPDKPWEGTDYFARDNDMNVDLMALLGTWGKGAVSLHEAAMLSGIPGKFATEGEQVAAMWLKGQWREIVQYNCFDALTTYLLWLRCAHFGGHFTREQYAAEQELVHELLVEEGTKDGGEYLEQFSEEWERLRRLTGQEP